MLQIVEKQKMFDKRALNNEIFPLKSKIGRAKVHIINALSKKTKKFKLLLEKSPDNLKLKARHDAAIEQIHALKKINLREVAKTAITDLSNPLETLKSATSSLDEKALAKLYSHEFVVSAVKEIKTKHNLNDENDKWRDFIKDIGEHKKKRKDEQKKKLKEIKIIKKQKSKELKKTNPHKEKKPKKDVSDNPLKIKKQKLAESPTSDVESDTNKKDESNTDLFFVTQNGENYQSIVKSNNPVSDDSDEDAETEIRKHKRFMKQTGSKNRQDDITKRNFTKKPYQNDRYSNKHGNQKRFSNPKDNSHENEQLHPSWAAKKKQKIADFQGTKINFDDDATPQIVRSKSFNPKPMAEEDKTLHPSWAAKMKQKTLVKEFQGQKIKFED